MPIEIFITILVNVAVVLYVATVLWILTYIDRRMCHVHEELLRRIRHIERASADADRELMRLKSELRG